MLTRTSATKICPGNYNITFFYTLRKTIVKSLKQMRHNLFSFRAFYTIGQVTGKHLVSIQVIDIGIIPYSIFKPVVISIDIDGFALFDGKRIFIIRICTSWISNFAFKRGIGYHCWRSQVYKGCFISHPAFKIAVCRGNNSHIISRNPLPGPG